MGALVAIYPGPVFIELRSDGLYYSPNDAGTSLRSRLCEQVWLDVDLFNLGSRGHIYAIDAAEYTRQPSSFLSAPELRRPGMFGEQLVIQDVDWAALATGHLWQVADAKLRVIAPVTLQTPAGNVSAVELEIAEEGLVEPGAIIVLVS